MKVFKNCNGRKIDKCRDCDFASAYALNFHTDQAGNITNAAKGKRIASHQIDDINSILHCVRNDLHIKDIDSIPLSCSLEDYKEVKA